MFVEENIKKYRRKKARAILLLSKILRRIDTLKEKKKKGETIEAFSILTLTKRRSKSNKTIRTIFDTTMNARQQVCERSHAPMYPSMQRNKLIKDHPETAIFLALRSARWKRAKRRVNADSLSSLLHPLPEQKCIRTRRIKNPTFQTFSIQISLYLLPFRISF